MIASREPRYFEGGVSGALLERCFSASSAAYSFSISRQFFVTRFGSAWVRDDAKRKQRQEERKALGLALDPLADRNDDGLQAGERNVAEDAAREKAAEKRPDPLLRESAAILADAVHLLASDRRLSAQVLPESGGPGRWTH